MQPIAKTTYFRESTSLSKTDLQRVDELLPSILDRANLPTTVRYTPLTVTTVKYTELQKLCTTVRCT
jgi:hypothetical protein